MHRSFFVAVALTLALGASSVAQAQEQQPQGDGTTHVLRVSKLYSFGGGTDLQHGFGLDLRWRYYPDREDDGFFGVFGQGQYELGDAWRFDGGITGGWGVFGIELGISHRTATRDYAGSTGLHIGQSITFGPISIGGRLTIPLVDYVEENVSRTQNVQGIEGALTISLGWDFTLSGPSRNDCHGHHGARH